MRNHRIPLAIALVALAALCAAPAAAESLDLSAGTMQLGGSLTFTSMVFVPEEGDSETFYLLSVQPTFAAFVAQGLEIGGGLGATAWFGDAEDMFNSQVNLFFSVRYVIDTRTIVSPYFGGKFGASFLIPSDDETDVDTSTAIFVAVPMGVLLALNKSVAISLGLEVQVYAWLDGPYMKDTVQLQVPVGYIGVEAFF